jgi:trk system potassium uptake protein TrkA
LRFIQGTKRVISSQVIQGQAEIMEILVSERMGLLGAPISKLSLPEGVLIVAIHRGENVIIPNGSTEINVDDKVIIFCLLSDVPQLEKLFKTAHGMIFSK